MTSAQVSYFVNLAIVTEQHLHISCDDINSFCTFPAIVQAKVLYLPCNCDGKTVHTFPASVPANILYISCDCARKTFCIFHAIVPGKHFVYFLRLCQQNSLYTYPATMPAKHCVYIACEYASKNILYAFPSIMKAKTVCLHSLRLCMQSVLIISCDCDSKTFYTHPANVTALCISCY